MDENKELLNEYQKGYISCLCKAIQRGSKKISTDLETSLRGMSKQGTVELTQMADAGEKRIRQAVEEIANRFDVNFFYKENVPVEIKHGIVSVNEKGITKTIKEAGAYKTGTIPAMILYKHEEDLQRYLALLETKNKDENYHRELGNLFGYGEKEIEEFIARQKIKSKIIKQGR